MHALATLEEAVPLLRIEDDLILGLPIADVLAQRFRLPSVDPSEFPEMVRIQIEKALPYSPDEVTTDFEVIEQNESDSVVSAVAVRNERLAEMAAPLLERGFIPRQVTIYASQRATTHAPQGRALLIYPEGEALVSAVTENGKVSLTRTLEGIQPEQLQTDLPQLTLSAELQGISGSFPNILLDETCFDLRDTVEGIMTSRPELVGIERPPASVKLNLLPESWRQRRAQIVRRGEWRKRLIWAGGAYAAIFLLIVLYLGLLHFKIGRLDRLIAQDAPKTEFVRAADANWRALAPAIDTRYYPVEILLHLFESLPSQDVRITTYNQSARQISVDGESDTAALAYQLADKVKKNPHLQIFQFTMADPRILPNGHAQFRLEGRAR
ncbi:MAG: Type pilus assembly protein PilM [Verrucomicrobiota bacterium]